MSELAELGSWLCFWNDEEESSCLLCATILFMYIVCMGMLTFYILISPMSIMQNYGMMLDVLRFL